MRHGLLWGEKKSGGGECIMKRRSAGKSWKGGSVSRERVFAFGFDK